MNIKDTINTGKGWILPNGKCLEISMNKNDLRGLAEHEPNIKSLFLLRSTLNTHDYSSVLDYIYESRYVRVGKYQGTVLFEHGALSCPTSEEMYNIAGKIVYKQSGVNCMTHHQNTESFFSTTSTLRIYKYYR